MPSSSPFAALQSQYRLEGSFHRCLVPPVRGAAVQGTLLSHAALQAVGGGVIDPRFLSYFKRKMFNELTLRIMPLELGCW